MKSESCHQRCALACRRGLRLTTALGGSKPQTMNAWSWLATAMAPTAITITTTTEQQCDEKRRSSTSMGCTSRRKKQNRHNPQQQPQQYKMNNNNHNKAAVATAPAESKHTFQHQQHRRNLGASNANRERDSVSARTPILTTTTTTTMSTVMGDTTQAGAYTPLSRLRTSLWSTATLRPWNRSQTRSCKAQIKQKG